MAGPKKEEPPQINSMSGCLVRACWMLAGNGALFVLAVSIAQGASGLFTWLDLAYWAVVAGLMAVRYSDIRYLNGQTAMGEPATIRHWRRYAVLLIVVSLVLWALAHGVKLCYS